MYRRTIDCTPSNEAELRGFDLAEPKSMMKMEVYSRLRAAARSLQLANATADQHGLPINLDALVAEVDRISEEVRK